MENLDNVFEAPQSVCMACGGKPSYEQPCTGIGIHGADEALGFVGGKEDGGVYSTVTVRGKGEIIGLIRKCKARGNAFSDPVGETINGKAKILAFHRMDYCRTEKERRMGMKDVPCLGGMAKGELLETACKDLYFTAMWETTGEFAEALNNGFPADQYWIYAL